MLGPWRALRPPITTTPGNALSKFAAVARLGPALAVCQSAYERWVERANADLTVCLDQALLRWQSASMRRSCLTHDRLLRDERQIKIHGSFRRARAERQFQASSQWVNPRHELELEFFVVAMPGAAAKD